MGSGTEPHLITSSELQKMIEAARGPYTPGQRMDQYTDQDILVGLLDGLGGDEPRQQDSEAWAAGIWIGNALRRTLK